MTKLGAFGSFLYWACLLFSFSEARAADITPQVRWGEAPASLRDPLQVHYIHSDQNEINRGYTPLTQWMRIDLRNDEQHAVEKLLLFDSPLVGRLHLYQGGRLQEEPLVSGPGYPLQQRQYPARLGAFLLKLEPEQEVRFYVQRDVHHALNTRVFLQTQEEAASDEAQAKMIFYFYLGGIFSLVIYNLLLGLVTHQKDYLSYSLFAASFGVTALVLHGVVDTYIWPNAPVVISNYLMFFSSLTLFAASFFVGSFLSIKKDFAVGYWGVRLFQCLAGVTMVASFFAPDQRGLFFFGYWIDISIAAAIVFFIFCGFYSLYRQGNLLARYFLFSWLVVLLGTSVWLASFHGLVRNNAWTQYSLLLANLGEMLILSLGLAYKIKVLNEEKMRAQQAAEDKERYHRLVRVLSHDVANTVSGLIYHSEMLQEFCPGEAEQLHLGRITKSIEQLNGILRSVRQEEVFQSNRAHLDLQAVELSPACWEALNHYSWQIQEKGLSIHVEVPTGIYVRADRAALINQVLSNLLSNCIKFSESGCCISLLMSERMDSLVLTVQDQGIGILEEELAHLFKGTHLFSRTGTANEKGSGMGTALVMEYMKLFGGSIEIQSVHRSQGSQSGTKVHLVFPRHEQTRKVQS
ncbi:sensor histidine kinase [Bdellovibrio bacteriovorus]|uniref:sensor histidine kinase n=1 Tax=Bdellovibrio bacteriovorus TaxID=959 RepID=UPI0021D15C23|nr:sensor histidine kinase [Bdellovibrio bacteriovorus]UXR66062.1 sensor histidine kinase [Bdellovibrio bacteriovorus]